MPSGPISGAGFVSGAGAVATAPVATFAYDTTSSTLWYDADGTGSVGAEAIAVLSNHAALNAADIWFI
jgi:hypothetical protein